MRIYTSTVYQHPVFRDRKLAREIMRAVLANRPITVTWQGKRLTIGRADSA